MITPSVWRSRPLIQGWWIQCGLRQGSDLPPIRHNCSMAKQTDIALLSRRTITSSSILLGTVWLAAFASVSGAQSYRDQLDAGVEAAKILTTYDSLASLVPIAMIAAWIFTTRWLYELYRVAQDTNPVAMR